MPKPPSFAPRPSSAAAGGGGLGGIGSGGSQGLQTLREIVAGATESAVTDVGGVIAVKFGVINLGASQSAALLYTDTPGSTIQANQVGLVVPFRGSLAAISFKASANKTAGTATFRPYVGGAASSLFVDWVTGADKGYKAIAQSSAIFEAGSEVDVRVTTDGSFTPTTVDVQITLFIVLNPTTTL
jgi:hypothetical protein